ncbi:MAG: glycosyltransferase [Bacteroidia bacterium]
MTPEISIITPAYNASLYIKESISSVVKQAFTAWELIIVNDGSTDNTENIVREFLADRRIILINQPNRGVSAARNAGIRAATGKYIGFLDADDYLLVNDLNYKFDVLEKNRMVDFVYSDVIFCDDKLNEIEVLKGVESENLFKEALLWQREVIPTLPSNVIGRASLFKEKLQFDEKLSNCADRLMKIELAKNAIGAYIPEALVKYRDTPGSMSKKIWLLEHDEEYIIHKIIEDNIIPKGVFRRKVISNIYFTISGSWYKDGKNTLRAIKYAFKAFIVSPVNTSVRMLKKIPVLLGITNKG